MNVLLYGTKQAAYCFFKTFKKLIKNMRYKQSRADPCLYFAWVENVLVVLVAWIDNVMNPLLWTNKFSEILRRRLGASGKGNSWNMWVVS